MANIATQRQTFSAPTSVRYDTQSERRRSHIVRNSEIQKQRRHHFQTKHSMQSEVKDTLQHAALINIVAAVNEDFTSPRTSVSHEAPGSVIDSLNNTMAVINNLLTPRDKTVSIPKNKTNVFQLPEETVQRKPVYYKHSEDQEVKSKEHQVKIRGYFETKDTRRKSLSDSVVPKVRPLPLTETNTIYKPIFDNRPKSVSSSTSSNVRNTDQELRSTPTTRRLGEVKGEQRKPHNLPKCNAIDFLDTTPEQRLNYYCDESGYLHIGDKGPASQPAPVLTPYVRANTLPVAFPAKSNKKPRARSCQGTRAQNSRPISSSLKNRRPDSLYNRVMNMPGGFCFDNLEINNGVNQEPMITSPVSQDLNKRHRLRLPFVGILCKRHWGAKLNRPRFSEEGNIGFHTLARPVIILDAKNRRPSCGLFFQQMKDMQVKDIPSEETAFTCTVNDDDTRMRDPKQVSFNDQTEAFDVSSQDNHYNVRDVTEDNEANVCFSDELQYDTGNTFVTQLAHTADQSDDSQNTSNNKCYDELQRDPAAENGDSNVTFGASNGSNISSNNSEGLSGKTAETGEFFKVIKAIDPRPYEGFAHRKNRKFGFIPSKSTPDEKSHYVKIKLW